MLRGSTQPDDVSVIPNAVVANDFTPDPSKRSKERITIVVASRLVYRKGTDLLIKVIPTICKEFPEIDFLIGMSTFSVILIDGLIAGDGNKRIDLEQMREQHVLQDRVTLLGAIRHSEVRDV